MQTLIKPTKYKVKVAELSSVLDLVYNKEPEKGDVITVMGHRCGVTDIYTSSQQKAFVIEASTAIVKDYRYG